VALAFAPDDQHLAVVTGMSHALSLQGNILGTCRAFKVKGQVNVYVHPITQYMRVSQVTMRTQSMFSASTYTCLLLRPRFFMEQDIVESHHRYLPLTVYPYVRFSVAGAAWCPHNTAPAALPVIMMQDSCMCDNTCINLGARTRHLPRHRTI
jgi:hypothetical protein